MPIDHLQGEYQAVDPEVIRDEIRTAFSSPDLILRIAEDLKGRIDQYYSPNQTTSIRSVWQSHDFDIHIREFLIITAQVPGSTETLRQVFGDTNKEFRLLYPLVINENDLPILVDIANLRLANLKTAPAETVKSPILGDSTYTFHDIASAAIKIGNTLRQTPGSQNEELLTRLAVPLLEAHRLYDKRVYGNTKGWFRLLYAIALTGTDEAKKHIEEIKKYYEQHKGLLFDFDNPKQVMAKIFDPRERTHLRSEILEVYDPAALLYQALSEPLKVQTISAQFADEGKHFPTFNSRSIESNLHSEQYQRLILKMLALYTAAPTKQQKTQI